MINSPPEEPLGPASNLALPTIRSSLIPQKWSQTPKRGWGVAGTGLFARLPCRTEPWPSAMGRFWRQTSNSFSPLHEWNRFLRSNRRQKIRAKSLDYQIQWRPCVLYTALDSHACSLMMKTKMNWRALVSSHCWWLFQTVAKCSSEPRLLERIWYVESG